MRTTRLMEHVSTHCRLHKKMLTHRRWAAAAGILAWLMVLPPGACGDDPAESADAAGAPPAQRDAAITHEKVEAALEAADRYFNGGDDGKAEAIILALLKQAPDEPRAHEMQATILLARANSLRQRGLDDEARALFAEAHGCYERVIELSEAHAGLELSAGRVAQAAGRLPEALAHFRAASALAPADPSAAILEANLLLQMDRVAEARDAIDRAVALDDSEPYALATLAIVLKEQGENDAALERIRQARESARPQDELTIRVIEARLHRQLGEPERALQLLLPLPEPQRAQEGVAFEIAESSLAAGKPQQALDAWALRFRQSGDWRAALSAARQALAMETVDEAWRWLRQAELIAPSAPEVREFYATLRQRNQNGADSGD